MKSPIAAALLALTSALVAQQNQTQKIEVTGANSANITWDSVPGRGYFLQVSSNLLEWNYLPMVKYGDGTPQFSHNFTSSGDKIFARLHYMDIPHTGDPELGDFDGDGVLNIDEVTTLGGTNPFNGDTDGDGKSDWQEFVQGTDPKDFGSAVPAIHLDVQKGSAVVLDQSLINSLNDDTFHLFLSDSSVTVPWTVTWTTSHEDPSYIYDWTEISATGIELDFTSDANAVHSKQLSFSFPYYQQSVSEVFIALDGYLTTETLLSAPSISAAVTGRLPSTNVPSGAIAPLMADLNLGATGKVFYQEFVATGNASPYLVVQWDNVEVPVYGQTAPVTFQCKVYESGKIEYLYQSMSTASVPSDFGGTEELYSRQFIIGHQDSTQTEAAVYYAEEGSYGNIRLNDITNNLPFSLKPYRLYNSQLDWVQTSGPSHINDLVEWSLAIDSTILPIGQYGPASMELIRQRDFHSAYSQILTLDLINSVTDGDDSIHGTIGHDTNLRGVNGHDTIIGYTGNDEIFGDAGNDTIDGGLGDDLLNGGSGGGFLRY